MLAALRCKLAGRRSPAPRAAIGAVAFVLAAGGSLKIDLSSGGTVNKDTAGRANLISGGAELFADRPLQGYGSGSFSTAFRHQAGGKAPVTESHTEPITIAAEQGLIGLILYLGLLAVALWTNGRPAEPDAGSWQGPSERGSTVASVGADVVARAAVLAMFIALIVHTLAYAVGFTRTRSPGCCWRSRGRWRSAPPRRLGPMSGYLALLGDHRRGLYRRILSKLIAVALLPLYTRYLTPADYGAAEVLFAAVVAASIVVRLGAIEALLRFYYKEDEDPGAVLSSWFACSSGATSAGALIALPLPASRSPKPCSTGRTPGWCG